MIEQVEAVWLKETGPNMLLGQLETTTNGFKLKLDSEERPPVGSRLILYGTNIQMMSTKVTEHFYDGVLLKAEERQTDKRLHPRLYGNIPTRLQAYSTEHLPVLVNDWLEGQHQVLSGWITPEPFMNFSVNGLSFEVSTMLEEGCECLVEFSVGDLETKHRAVATVIRCTPKESTFEVAIHFEQMPYAAMVELSDFTISIQDALLQQ